MKYSSSLLSHLVSSTLLHNPEILEKALLGKVCEVEATTIRAIDPLVVVGKVLDVYKHPQADTLFIVQLDCGHHGTVQICTGGENVEHNTYVPVALPGSYLSVIDLHITPRTMRGALSHGMICSKEELGIPEDIEKHWIWTMNYDFPHITDDHIGQSFSLVLPGLMGRTMDIENKTITHRADLFGHFGLAIEILAIDPDASLTSFGQRIVDHCSLSRTAPPPLADSGLADLDGTTLSFRVESSFCSSYALLSCSLQIGWRPSCLDRVSLYEIGMGAKGTVVDLSNLFMVLTGQPIHMFDADKVMGSIVVRQARDGEMFVDLHGKEHTLAQEDIVIADDHSILALAGIMGGLRSAVDDETTNIAIELAHFDPVRVRKTAVRLGLRTDAATRFEKYINPVYTHNLCRILQSWLSTMIDSPVLVVDQRASDALHDQWQSFADKHLSLDWDALSCAIYGDTRLDKERARWILERLGCVITSDHRLQIPSWRTPQEWNCTADVVEEVARHLGFDTIADADYTITPRFVAFPSLVGLRRRFEELACNDLHMHQVETYPWTLPHHMTHLSYHTDALYTMENPLTPEQLYLRPTLHWHLVDVLAKNAPYRDEMSIFDIGSIWTRSSSSPEGHRGKERLVFAAAWWSETRRDAWDTDLFLRAKGALHALFHKALGVSNLHRTVVGDSLTDLYSPISTDIYHPKQHIIGSINPSSPPSSSSSSSSIMLATVHPLTLQAFSLPPESSLVVAEIDITALVHHLDQLVSIRDTSQSQSQSYSHSHSHYNTLQDHVSTKDVSFLVPLDTTFGRLVEAVSSVPTVRDVTVFDIYEGDRIPAGYKSISLRCTLVGEGSLSGDDIATVFSSIIAAGRATGALLRE